MSETNPILVLASASPRRRMLLARLGLAFTVRPAAIDESPCPDEDPCCYVIRLATEKAAAVAQAPEAAPDELVLAADTAVVHDGALLGKPDGAHAAKAMLQRLSGARHEVLTGVAVHRPHLDLSVAVVERTWVRFATLTEPEIDWYVGSGEPFDKAGAYGIQGLGALFVERIEGNYSNVVGLPLPAVYRLLQRVGYDLRARAAGATPREDT